MSAPRKDSWRAPRQSLEANECCGGVQSTAHDVRRASMHVCHRPPSLGSSGWSLWQGMPHSCPAWSLHEECRRWAIGCHDAPLPTQLPSPPKACTCSWTGCPQWRSRPCCRLPRSGSPSFYTPCAGTRAVRKRQKSNSFFLSFSLCVFLKFLKIAYFVFIFWCPSQILI